MTGRLVTPVSRALLAALALVAVFAVLLALQLLAAGPQPLLAELDHAADVAGDLMAAMLLPQTRLDLVLGAAFLAAAGLSSLAPATPARRAGDMLGLALLPLYLASNIFQLFAATIPG